MDSFEARERMKLSSDARDSHVTVWVIIALVLMVGSGYFFENGIIYFLGGMMILALLVVIISLLAGTPEPDRHIFDAASHTHDDDCEVCGIAFSIEGKTGIRGQLSPWHWRQAHKCRHGDGPGFGPSEYDERLAENVLLRGKPLPKKYQTTPKRVHARPVTYDRAAVRAALNI